MIAMTPNMLTTPLHARIHEAIAQAGGWLGFDTFMRIALYTPGIKPNLRKSLA